MPCYEAAAGRYGIGVLCLVLRMLALAAACPGVSLCAVAAKQLERQPRKKLKVLVKQKVVSVAGQKVEIAQD
jgi:hypothetical protein